jgi:fructose-1,6-bisphosphatase III
LLDRAFPTIDWSDPYKLSDAEAQCMARFKQAFIDSHNLWRDMRFVADKGGMMAVRDEMVVFHGCIPSDANGKFVPFTVDGEPRSGKDLFVALDRVVRRAFRERKEADIDVLYYLWTGARSPLFGKDRMATFETYFVADKSTYKETKDPYFQLINDKSYCESVARELGVAPNGVLIVNGHVPVKLEAGESPLKKSGLAVTIDGAFSEAYGDHGYTLVWDADGAYLAKHHHFESVESAIERGADIVPEVERLRTNERPRHVGDTPRGADLREEIADLQSLVAAYRSREIEPPTL